MELIVSGLNTIDTIAREFIKHLGNSRVLAFYGSMGAGKTTFIKAICKQMEVTDQVNSPTFAIVNEYKTRVGSKVCHFDFYRIKNLEEAFDFGYEDYFYSGDYCFIEWPELIEPILPENTLKITIHVNDDGSRTIIF
jgi:tRNA threonylcarbamoyladenosine biosynthesis protein TsaE